MVITKEQLIETLYKTLKDNYPDCKDIIKEDIELFEKGIVPKPDIIWMWIEEDVKKWSKLK